MPIINEVLWESVSQTSHSTDIRTKIGDYHCFSACWVLVFLKYTTLEPKIYLNFIYCILIKFKITLGLICLDTIQYSALNTNSYGGTSLNNPPIKIHANSSMFALIFWPHMTIFCIFWLYECRKWILEFNSKSLFWCQSRQIFKVRVIEQRHNEFQLIHMPPHQFWPRYHSDGLSPVHVRFEFFSNQICNVEALICHLYKIIKTLTQIHFPRDAHIFRTCTIFYRHYKGLHQMRKDLVLCAHIIHYAAASRLQQINTNAVLPADQHKCCNEEALDFSIPANRGGSTYGPNWHPPFWQINHANSVYFRLFLGYFQVISATWPPVLDLGPPFYISWIRPCLPTLESQK